MTSWLGVALRRAAHDAALVAAAALVVLVASGVLVGAAIYPDAIVRAGIARTLAAADPVASGVSVAIDVRQPDALTFDATVREVVAAALGPASGDIGLTAMSEAYGLLSADAQSPATRFASADGIESHAHLLRGRWGVDGGPGTADSPTAIDAAVSEPAARALRVDVGSVLEVASRLDPRRRFTVTVVGVFALNDAADAFWGGDPLLLGGTEQRGPFTTLGPLFIGRQALLDRTIVTRASLAWRAVPVFGRFAPENLSAIGGNVGALPDRLAGRLGRGQAIVVRSELPRLLGAVSSGLTQAGSGSTLVAGQMVVLAMYALIFVAALVVGQRRATTSLLRARGASARHLVGLALIEALVVAAPAAALGLPLGLWLAAFLADAGPSVATASNAVAPAVVRLSQPVVGLAAIAGLVAVVGLTLPTALAVGPLARVHRSPGRQRAAALLQRSRIDLALAGLGAIALWRLRGSAGAAEVTATPLAAAGPAIGLLAGAILLLRIVPVIGRGMEGGLVRGASVGGALSVRSVARRSAAYARPALLFAMSAAIGLFAVGYARTWQGSQRDQAAHAVGADIRGQVGPGATLSAAAATVYRAIPGVTGATPVAHEDFATGPDLQHGMLLAVVPEAMRSIAAFRPDLGTRPFGDLMADLVTARPDPPLLSLPTGAQRVRVRVDLLLSPIAGAAGLPTGWAGLSVGLVIRDADGLLRRVTSTPALGTPADAYVLALPAPPKDAGPGAVAIVAVELRLALPGGQILTGSVGIRSVEASLATTGETWAPIETGAALGAWTMIRSAFDVRPTPLRSGPDTVPGDLIAGTIAPQAPLTGPGTQAIVARAAALADVAAAPLAGLIDPALSTATGTTIGDMVLVRHASSVTRKIRAVGVVTAFPGLAVTGVAIVDFGSFQLAQYATDETIPAPDEWWLSVSAGSDRQVLAALSIGPGALQGLHSRAIETESRINDPIALAISGMLILAAAAAAAFAAIGFVAAAWASTQSRLPEFAVARALGLSRRQIGGWLVLEQAFPIAIGVSWGIVLGLALEWLVLPAVTLAPGGGPALPAALVAVPPDLVGAYFGLAILLVAVTAVVLARTVERAGMTEPLRGES